MKKTRNPNVHEELIRSLCVRSLNSRTTFFPKQWNNGLEPADIMILVGRTIVLINATSGKSYFQSLSDHNINQARRIINEWSFNNKYIISHNNEFPIRIKWDDIDNILIISVVDGPHCGCMTHNLDDMKFNEKVKMCATITSETFRTFSKLNGSINDIVIFCKMIGFNNFVSEYSAIKMVHTRYNTINEIAKMDYPRSPSRVENLQINGKILTWQDLFIENYRQARVNTIEEAFLFSDIGWRDIIPAMRFAGDAIAQVEYLNEGAILRRSFGFNRKFWIVVSTNSKALLNFIPEFSDSILDGSVDFIHILSVSNFGIQHIINFNSSSNMSKISDLSILID